MEERLAEDIRREAATHGRVLVAREVLPSSEQASATIQDFYETLTGALAHVCTRQLAECTCVHARTAARWQLPKL